MTETMEVENWESKTLGIYTHVTTPTSMNYNCSGPSNKLLIEQIRTLETTIIFLAEDGIEAAGLIARMNALTRNLLYPKKLA